MPTTVYRGSDGTISVAVEQGLEGDKAKTVADAFSLTPIGRVTGVTVKVTNDVKPFHELGQRFPTELRPGNINVYGTIERAYINGALLKLMLGDAADSRPAGTFVGPSFNLNVRLENPSIPGVTAEDLAERIRAHGHRNVTYVGDNRAEIVERLLDIVRTGDLVLTLGAGDVGQLGPDLVRRLSAADRTGG